MQVFLQLRFPPLLELCLFERTFLQKLPNKHGQFGNFSNKVNTSSVLLFCTRATSKEKQPGSNPGSFHLFDLGKLNH